MTALFFLAAFLTLGAMFWPYMIPYSLTVAGTAAPEASLQFLFYGGIVVLPVIAAYTIGVYWVFRGKVNRGYADFGWTYTANHVQNGLRTSFGQRSSLNRQDRRAGA